MTPIFVIISSIGLSVAIYATISGRKLQKEHEKNGTVSMTMRHMKEELLSSRPKIDQQRSVEHRKPWFMMAIRTLTKWKSPEIAEEKKAAA